MVTTASPFSVVEAPLQRVPKFTVLTTAQALGLVAEGQVTVPDVGDDTPDLGTAQDRWLNGFGFRPWACGQGNFWDPCAGPNAGPLGPTDPTNASAEYWQPYVIEDGVACTTLSGTDDQDYIRARHLLNVRQHYWAAVELWDGYVTQTASTGNPFLGDGTATPLASGATVGLIVALATLEDAIAGSGEVSIAAQGMIHASPRIVTEWRALDLVHDTGSGYLATELGTPVVTGPGANGDNGDGGGTATLQYAYTTGLLTVRVGRVQVLNRDHRDADRSTNLNTVWAQRAMSVAYDSCAVTQIKIDPTKTGITWS